MRDAKPDHGQRRSSLARALGAVAAGVLGLALIGLAIQSLSARSTLSEPLPRSEQVRVRWPMHERFGFALEWKTHRTGEPDSELRGEIALERIGGAGQAGDADGVQRLALRYARLDAEKSAAALLGQVAYLDVDPRGQITSIAFADGVTKTGEIALRRLALQLGYTLPERSEPAWELDQRTALGEARVHYRGGEAELAREVVRYARIDGVPSSALAGGVQASHGLAVIALDADQLPISIEERAKVELTPPGAAAPSFESATLFSLRRTSRGHGDESPAGEAARPNTGTAKLLREPQALRESR